MTNETSTELRPVEELIGWTPHGDLGWWWCDTPWQEGEGRGRVRAEVDDLAAWLRERRGAVYVGGDIQDGLRWWVDLEDGAPAFGDSIRDALIAAVRKVAG